MGGRANVYVHEGDEPGVYLYTHHDGYRLPETVRQAMARGQRWDDTPYLTRIIFCEMVGPDYVTTTGYGISTQLGDGDDQMIDVDTDSRVISLTRHGSSTLTYGFSEYAAYPSAEWPDADDES